MCQGARTCHSRRASAPVCVRACARVCYTTPCLLARRVCVPPPDAQPPHAHSHARCTGQWKSLAVMTGQPCASSLKSTRSGHSRSRLRYSGCLKTYGQNESCILKKVQFCRQKFERFSKRYQVSLSLACVTTTVTTDGHIPTHTYTHLHTPTHTYTREHRETCNHKRAHPDTREHRETCNRRRTHSYTQACTWLPL